jgi:hypothetical protein
MPDRLCSMRLPTRLKSSPQTAELLCADGRTILLDENRLVGKTETANLTMAPDEVLSEVFILPGVRGDKPGIDPGTPSLT